MDQVSAIALALRCVEALVKDARMLRDEAVALHRLAHDEPIAAVYEVLDGYASLDLMPDSPPGSLRQLLILLADLGLRLCSMDWLAGAVARGRGEGMTQDGDWCRGWRFLDGQLLPNA